MDLDGDDLAVDAEQGGAGDRREHGGSARPGDPRTGRTSTAGRDRGRDGIEGERTGRV